MLTCRCLSRVDQLCDHLRIERGRKLLILFLIVTRMRAAVALAATKGLSVNRVAIGGLIIGHEIGKFFGPAFGSGLNAA
jgi:hypothetical protein